MRFAFYVSGKANRLIRYLEQATVENKELIKVIISEYQVSIELEKVLKESNIPVVIYEYKNLPGKNNQEKNRILSQRMMETLDQYGIDYCFSFGAHILSGDLLEKYKYKIINFHPSILPMYPGKNAIDQAVEAGNTFLVGNTAHFIDSGVDTGPIIMQSVIPLQAFLNNENNYDIVLDIQIEMLKQLIVILKEELIKVENDRVIIKGAEYRDFMIFPTVKL